MFGMHADVVIYDAYDISSCPDILLLAAVGLIWDCALQSAAFQQG